jgi:hypothetical protein
MGYGVNWFGSIGELLRRSSFRYNGERHLPFVPGRGDIEIAVATAVFSHIRLPVRTGADDIFIGVTITGCESAGATHVPVAVTIQEKAGEEIEHPFPVPVEIVPFWFLYPLEHVVELLESSHRPKASRMSDSLYPMMTLSPIRIVGKLHAGLYFLTSSIAVFRVSPVRRSTSVHRYVTPCSLMNFFAALQ